jgi:hypothetical protein
MRDPDLAKRLLPSSVPLPLLFDSGEEQSVNHLANQSNNH